MSNNPLTSVGLASARFRRWRAIKDKLARAFVTIGGLSAIFAILLIFVYLMYEVLPLFKPATIEKAASYELPLSVVEKQSGQETTLYMSVEEQAEVGLRVTQSGQAVFFDTKTGQVKDSVSLPIPNQVHVTALAADTPTSRVFALGLSSGQVLLVQHNYTITYPNDQRTVTPSISYPYGEQPLEIMDDQDAILKLAIRGSDKALLVVAEDKNHDFLISRFKKETNALSGETSLQRQNGTIPLTHHTTQQLLISDNQRWVFLINEKQFVDVFDVRSVEKPTLNDRIKITDANSITQADFLLGGVSLLFGDSNGSVSQWFMVRDKQNRSALKKIRSFESDERSPIVQMTTEQRRKGFLTVNAKSELGIYNSTAQRELLKKVISNTPIQSIALAPRANALLTASSTSVDFWRVHNEHPEVSWSALWDKVWYEGYSEPDYVWQSSASNNEFEPKFSLMPLAFGTLKAAFYAMLLATPLAICAAIYTAYFMAPALRRKVKPTIELMAALPTVILGFLAGLWLAPYVEKHLAGIFCLLLVVPLGIFVFSFLWYRLLGKLFHHVPEGWDVVVLVPVVILLGWLSLAMSVPIEDTFFHGDLRVWLNSVGIGYDQRNALIVGLAMGFAVIPSIFSIAEDAIFSVPKQLSYGSLALGATPWQTLVRVVLLTASPGIFSAVMIGMGRAVGETMIVLMSTGNTPVMSGSMFNGMRTLAANIAVEMPESEVGSTHFRILFLAALVLFLFTFIVNTLAELIRQHLRKRYESL